ncbi:hypothetical protein J6590_088351 [Homalodisca vitripennis]|nr:hypothetical protein J6590_088351 [Homalodisca vitripennis]
MSRRYVVDPLVELSSQTVILPQTPCNSFSLVQMYIRRYVMDPLTELSSQTVILPQTPCNSFLSGPHLHQVSAASHVITSTRYLVDPLVELSSQTVILPQTPCNSFSLVHIYIRSVQLAS